MADYKAKDNVKIHVQCLDDHGLWFDAWYVGQKDAVEVEVIWEDQNFRTEYGSQMLHPGRPTCTCVILDWLI
jgi:hypothetical protein